MRLLLDTHVLVWLAEGLPELKPASRERIDAAARKDGLAVSPISFWEVAMLHSRRRLFLSVPLPRWREVVLSTPGIVEVPLSGDVAIETVQLPGDLHDDPADRMIIATARIHRWQLATRDERILKYAAKGHVKALEV